MDTIAKKLKAIREALPDRPGVRQISRDMGSDKPNTYGYYESAQFKQDLLPLDKARLIAGIFARYGGAPEAVLALAGLSPDEAVKAAPATPVATVQYVQMSVAMPSADALTEMMRGMIAAAGHPEIADELAPKLAQRLPARLSELQAAVLVRASAEASVPGEVARPPAKSRRASTRPSHT